MGFFLLGSDCLESLLAKDIKSHYWELSDIKKPEHAEHVLVFTSFNSGHRLSVYLET